MIESRENAALLSQIQATLRAPKGQFNKFGKYNYRSCEDILEAVKPILAKLGMAVLMVDDIVCVGNRNYVKSTALLINPVGIPVFEGVAFAREDDSKKGMDSAQLTGSTASYARKYALQGLFAIDDNQDSDYTSGLVETGEKKRTQVAYKVEEMPLTQGNGTEMGSTPAIKDTEIVDPEPDLRPFPVVQNAQVGELPTGAKSNPPSETLDLFNSVLQDSVPTEVIDQAGQKGGLYDLGRPMKAETLHFESEANKRFKASDQKKYNAQTLDAYLLKLQSQSKTKGKGKSLDELKAQVTIKDTFNRLWDGYCEACNG